MVLHFDRWGGEGADGQTGWDVCRRSIPLCVMSQNLFVFPSLLSLSSISSPIHSIHLSSLFPHPSSISLPARLPSSPSGTFPFYFIFIYIFIFSKFFSFFFKFRHQSRNSRQQIKYTTLFFPFIPLSPPTPLNHTLIPRIIMPGIMEQAASLEDRIATSGLEKKGVAELLDNLHLAAKGDIPAAALALASATSTTTSPTIIAGLRASLLDRKDVNRREKALEAVVALAAREMDAAVEPRLVSGLLGTIIERVGDKNATANGRDLAQKAALAIVGAANPQAVKAILPPLHNAIITGNKFGEKLLALKCVDRLVSCAPSQLSVRLPDLVPVMSEAMWDTKPEVKKAAKETMERVCSLIQNADIDRFIPALIRCIAQPENVPETVHLLGATTFVQEVGSSTLSIMVPLLSRGLNERDTTIKRKAAVIIDNMCKLVDDPQVVAPFLQKLIPALQTNHDNMADPEARSVTERALATLIRVGNVVDGKIPENSAGYVSVVRSTLDNIVTATLKEDGRDNEQDGDILQYVASIAAQLVDEKNNESQLWYENVTPFLAAVFPTEARAITETLRKRSVSSAGAYSDDDNVDDDDGEDLCNCDFSLAYGAKILLNRTNLHLKRGRRYGLCGPNGSGKSTLMRSIAEGKVDGFPPASELKTVYVEHDIDASEADTTVVEYTMNNPIVDAPREKVIASLTEFGFTESMRTAAISSLSGGWKMKLALAGAILSGADILLLDEPTNHLDVVNVAWLENFLKSQTRVTSMIVSHDSGFLDNVVQYIVHYERFKLKLYRGNLAELVKRVPAAKSYYDLSDSEAPFHFPEPGYLEGVKTKAKAIVRVTNMSFTYPGTHAPQIKDITFQCSLGSRIAVIGPNGAGKSTLIKVLTGELIPTHGQVYQHENCRIAYVAQHAFSVIENHLDSTPSEYIQWRFQTGEDRLMLDKAARQITQNDEEAMNKIYKVEGTQRRVIGIHSRRKLKNSYEYECSFALGENVGQKNERWTPMLSNDNAWLSRSELLESHAKLVAEVDMKEALASGQFRPLTRKEIEAHCALLGLEAELVSHSRIRGLSGGQKVKLVLAAGSWLRPHLIVLDEPTNYLDRDSLAALQSALKSFGGGVIIITHSSEFTRGLTEEIWSVLDGKMQASGHSWVQGQGAGPRIEEHEAEEQFDAFGNKVEIKKKVKLTSSEARKKKKERMARRKRGEEVFSDSD